MQIPYFDASDKISARTWLQKLQTYFTLNPMVEEVVKFATLHLDGIADNWWHHGLFTLGHDTSVSFDELSERLLNRFERKDENEFFHDLALSNKRIL